MPKRKVIEDSDDEDNAETTPPRRRAITPPANNVSPAIRYDGFPSGNHVQRSADPSTGSTELLDREIRAAHESLIEPTPNGSLPSTKNGFSSQGKSQPSPTMARTKIKRAKTAVETPRAKKPLKRYGTESKRDIFEFCGDSDGEIESIIGKDTGATTTTSSWGLSTGHTVALKDADLFPVQAEASNKLEKNSMPPPASKSTSEAQTPETSNMATTAEETHVKSTPAQPRFPDEMNSFEPTSSTSQMPNPTMSSRGQGDGERTPGIDKVEALHDSPIVDDNTHTLAPVGPSSSVSVLSPSKTITVMNKTHIVQPFHKQADFVDDGSTGLLPGHPKSDPVAPIVLLPQLSHSHEGMDELSFPSHGPHTWSVNQTTVSKAQKRKVDRVQTEEPGSDDAAIGLPKDQYQPRPSKSRSGRGNDEVIVPADFSKRPEAAAKKRSRTKRSKTTAFHELRAKGEEDEEDDLIEYKPTMAAIEEIPTRKYERIKEPDVATETEEPELKEDPQQEPKLVAKAVEKKKQRGKPKKCTTEAHEGTVREATEHSIGQGDAESEKVEDPTPAKKAKKCAKAKQGPLQISEQLVHDTNDELSDLDDVIRSSNNILSETQGNNATPKHTEKEATPLSPVKIANPSPTRAIETPPETPPKAGTLAQKGPDKHSPISSGKVAYRVGLSKRARITPLLRMVRKA